MLSWRGWRRDFISWRHLKHQRDDASVFLVINFKVEKAKC